MTKMLVKNRLSRKLIVFAFAFLITCSAVAIQVASPKPPLHKPLISLSQLLPRNILKKDFTMPQLPLDLSTLAMEGDVMVEALPTYAAISYTPGFTYLSEISLSYELQQYTFQRCQESGLEYEMVLAIMWRESLFQPYAVGVNKNGTKDSGLMQINDINRGWLSEHGISDLLDPYQNIDAGTLILSQYFSKYNENMALMAYQYGEQGMLNKVEEGMTTNELTEKVKNKRDEFKAMRMSV